MKEAESDKIQLLEASPLTNVPDGLLVDAQSKFALSEIAPKLITQSRLAPIWQIHRGPHGYIGFWRKISGDERQCRECSKAGLPCGNPSHSSMWDMGAFRADELEGYLPDLAPHIMIDSYFTVNTLYGQRSSYNRGISEVTGFPSVSRRENNLSFLNACYTDIDCGRDNDPDPFKRQPVSQALAWVIDQTMRREIPAPSITAFSGRGLYLLWLLNDDKTGLPPSAHKWRIELYKQVNEAINIKLREGVAADSRATDAARVLRTPGTVHSKSGLPSIWGLTAFRDPLRTNAYYSLEELAAAFHVRALASSNELLLHGPNHADNKPKRPFTPYALRDKTKRPGYRKQHESLAADILTLEQHAGGWAYPGRRKRLLCYARALRRANFPRDEILSRCQRMAENCKPSYPTPGATGDINETVEAIIREAWNSPGPAMLRTKYLLENFGVSYELAHELGLKVIAPKELIALRKAKAKLHSRAEAQKTRLRTITAILSGRGDVPSVRSMQELLRKSYNIIVSHQTIQNDYRALELAGKITPRQPGTKGRPRKNKSTDEKADKSINQ